VTAAYAADHWTDFAVATVSATATLVGLVFVAVSINLREILRSPNLPGRAALTLVMFVTPLLVGILVVVPGQPGTALAWELLAAGILVGAFQLLINSRSGRSAEETPMSWTLARVLPIIVTYACLIVAGATFLAHGGGGLYWLVPSVLVAIGSGLVNAWVLLVEILR